MLVLNATELNVCQDQGFLEIDRLITTFYKLRFINKVIKYMDILHIEGVGKK